MSAPPTSEIGYVVDQPGFAQSWQPSDTEISPDMQWPKSIWTADRMVDSDAQCSSVLRAVWQPILATQWRIDPAGADEKVTRLVAEDFGLPIVGEDEPEPEIEDGHFLWADHLELALLSVQYGHFPFEQVAQIVDGLARLRKLAPRWPHTLSAINVERDGGLKSIEQHGTSWRTGVPRPIPVDRLVMYVHGRNSNGWKGQSLLRPAYKHWIIKDRALTGWAQSNDRNGMGIPTMEMPAGASSADRAAALEIVTRARAGEAAGVVTPAGGKFRFVGVEGNIANHEALVRYNDEQTGHVALMHFLGLGSRGTTGSYALGDVFAEFFTLSLQGVAQKIATTATRHVIRDLVRWNFGNVRAPRLTFDAIGTDLGALAHAMKLLVDSGVIFPDRETEQHFRRVSKLPPKQAASPTTLGGAA